MVFVALTVVVFAFVAGRLHAISGVSGVVSRSAFFLLFLFRWLPAVVAAVPVGGCGFGCGGLQQLLLARPLGGHDLRLGDVEANDLILARFRHGCRVSCLVQEEELVVVLL